MYVVSEEIRRFATKYKERLQYQPNQLDKDLLAANENAK